MIIFALIILSVLINTAAQILLKQGMIRIGHFDFVWDKLFSVALQVAFNPYIIGGIFCYFSSMVVWLLVLSRTSVSYAYPMVSLGYVTTCIAAWYFFSEPITPIRFMGILVIIIGVYLVSRS